MVILRKKTAIERIRELEGENRRLQNENQTLQEIVEEQSDALIELAEIISEV
jgi:hypothetical protein